jgi:hypothetical protein
LEVEECDSGPELEAVVNYVEVSFSENLFDVREGESLE